MKSIVKRLPAAILIFLCLTGCKKDTETNNYLRGKIDGVAFECNSNIRATEGGAGDRTIFFQGDWPSHSIRFFFDRAGSSITAGPYNFQTGLLCNAVLYQNNDGYLAGFFCPSFSSCSFYGSGKITIMEITKKNIRGTFEFTTAPDVVTGQLKTITDGDFSIKRE